MGKGGEASTTAGQTKSQGNPMGSGASKAAVGSQEVKMCTSADNAPASPGMVAKVIKATFDKSICPVVLHALWKRMSDDNWQHSYKGLILLQGEPTGLRRSAPIAPASVPSSPCLLLTRPPLLPFLHRFPSKSCSAEAART